MADAANPNSIWGPNEYANLDGSGLSGPLGIVLAPGGLTVDRNRIPKTLNVSDSNGNPAHPVGDQGTSGY